MNRYPTVPRCGRPGLEELQPPSKPATWFFVLGLGVMEVGIVAFYLFMESRRRRVAAVSTA